MRWTPKPYAGPNVGDQRTVIKFAWLPVEIGRTFVWFERYEADQVYWPVIVGGWPHFIWWTVEARFVEPTSPA